MAFLKLESCDDFNFYLSTTREGNDLNGRTSRKGRPEIRGVNRIHVSKMSEVCHENGRFDNVRVVHPIGSENAADIIKNTSRLFPDASGNDFTRYWVQRDLSRAVECIAC